MQFTRCIPNLIFLYEYIYIICILFIINMKKAILITRKITIFTRNTYLKKKLNKLKGLKIN